MAGSRRALARPLVLFLDELEQLHSATALQLLQRLIADLPGHCQLVIGSRSLPELGLGRLRAHGELLQIGPSELSFSPAESRRLLQDKHQLQIADDQLAALQQRTEGWPVALQLAGQSLASHLGQTGFIAEFTGSNSALAEYLAEDILARLEPALQDFLLETSVLQQISAPLCDAVRQADDSRQMLDALERASLFILPLDLDRRWYRYHSLFAGFLRYRLERAQPGRLAQLHRRAAAWYLAAQRPVPAIDHLIAGQDADAAAALMARHADPLLAQGRVRLLARWLQAMPDDALQRYPRLRVIEAWTLVLNRRYPDAMRAVAAIVARAQAQAPDPQDSDRSALAIEAQTIRCLALSMSDRLDESLAAASLLIQRLPEHEAFQYGVLANILAHGAIARHRFDEARQILSWSLQRHALGQASFSRAVADYLEAAIDLVQGRLGQALARLRPLAVAHVGAERGRVRQAGHGRATVSVLLAVVLYERGELDEAQRLLADSLPCMKENGAPDALVISHTLSARMAAASGDRAQALRHLADLEAIGRDVAMPRVLAAVWLERAWLHWQAGALDEAQQALARARAGPAATAAGGTATAAGGTAASDQAAMFMTDIDLPELMAARLMLARGEAPAALVLLRRLLRDASAQQRQRRALRIRLLLALGLQASGRGRAALLALGSTLRDAAPEHGVRALLDEGPAMAALFGRWLASPGAGSAGVLPRFVSALQAAWQDAAPPTDRRHGEALTKRELGVLQLLADGLRNAQIAERLFVSETTVKAHLRNIFAKLQAKSRTGALVIARQQRLID